MKNKISIDNLVRQGIAKGEEPHNLGAWANMERMLDGKNPYQEEEESKRKPWLFMLLGLVVCSTAVLGGYNYFSGSEPSTANKEAVAQKSTNIVISEASPAFENDNNNFASDATIENESVANNYDNNSDEQLINSTTKNTIVKASTSNITSNNDVKNNSRQFKTASTTAKNTNNSTPIAQQKADRKIANYTSNKIADKVLEPNKIDNAIAATKTKTAFPTKKNQIAKSQLAGKASTAKAIDIGSKLAIAGASVDIDNNNIQPTIKQPYLDTINATKITSRIARDKYGNRKFVTDSSKFKVVREKVRIVVNPRYVELTKEQEEAAQRKTALASNSDKIDLPTMQAAKSISQSDPSIGLSAKNNTETKGKQKSEGFFSRFKNLGQKVKQKSINMAHTPIPIYTGMFVGVNAAFNSKHNFGGFQGGLTAMTPLSRLFSLQAEARFMHKNNSGYTVTDNKSTIMNTAVDSTSWVHGRIYNYQIDSVTTSYNLNSFYTIQIPVLLRLHLKKFDAYAGAHLNYGLRMNTSASQNTNPLYVSDTVTNPASYAQRTNTDTKFTRDDFGSRLGLGYTVGGSYNFNPNLYLDLRMSNLFWDNTKGAAKQEISDVFFKMPSFQLSLGYRFRKFDRER